MTVAPDDRVVVDRAEVDRLCRAALAAAGASPRVADLLTDAALFAEDRGSTAVGVAHLLDYLDAMDAGRLDGRAVPRLTSPAPAVVRSDARGGIAHAGFDEAFDRLTEAACRFGVAVFVQHGSYTCGQLAWFTERLADAGLVALATAVSPALLAAGPGTGRVFGTNPMSYSVPRVQQAPLTVDQASSVTAFVAVRDRAARGEALPEGWALDADGQPTSDAEAALSGALLPFGGYKGANIALFVELFSSMAGGLWSVDAPAFHAGSQSPAIGMFVLVVDHRALGEDFPGRVEQHVDRLADRGVRRPGINPGQVVAADPIELPADVVNTLRRRGGRDAARLR
ncbi:(2R)-3-sulfolactate dehydrogenase (NADP+) [Geodermatophilus telluris]|uniref:(2R)-3-sulfolactate dehydrogenase (NADP+) n=1 Tax=Geodermatophilus telluris TaxID=1190417 RepID=A0A1G6QLS7_9ACTN|nr:Ldh family oxidoreductase [Geodermatophilus telluris]SDC93319.1 (2R)-3-sulfolactate dehydrogenase (NADP+) [Geodermatophilus telluris]